MAKSRSKKGAQVAARVKDMAHPTIPLYDIEKNDIVHTPVWLAKHKLANEHLSKPSLGAVQRGRYCKESEMDQFVRFDPRQDVKHVVAGPRPKATRKAANSQTESQSTGGDNPDTTEV